MLSHTFLISTNERTISAKAKAPEIDELQERFYRSRRNSLLLLLLLFQLSCGYRLAIHEKIQPYQTFTVGMIEKDYTGLLTAALVKWIATTTHLTYCEHCPDLIVCLKVCDLREESIGFRYDEDKQGELTENVIPQENRVILVTELSLLRRENQEPLLFPKRLITFAEFDHEYYSSRDGINIFSLGQLGSLEVARETVIAPLAENLGSQVAEFLNCAPW